MWLRPFSSQPSYTNIDEVYFLAILTYLLVIFDIKACFQSFDGFQETIGGHYLAF